SLKVYGLEALPQRLQELPLLRQVRSCREPVAGRDSGCSRRLADRGLHGVPAGSPVSAATCLRKHAGLPGRTLFWCRMGRGGGAAAALVWLALVGACGSADESEDPAGQGYQPPPTIVHISAPVLLISGGQIGANHLFYSNARTIIDDFRLPLTEAGIPEVTAE